MLAIEGVWEATGYVELGRELEMYFYFEFPPLLVGWTSPWVTANSNWCFEEGGFATRFDMGNFANKGENKEISAN